MGIFGLCRCKKEAPVPAPRKKSADEILVEQLRAWKPVGSKIEYMGRVMTVTGHGTYGSLGMLAVYVIAELRAEYFDDCGVIHTHTFSRDHARALMESTKPKVAKGKRTK